MALTSKCPENKTEVNEASTRIGCGFDVYGNSQYMCIPNEKKSSLVEFCFNGIMGIEEKGSCLENSNGKITRYNCSSFTSGCPNTTFYKYNVFEYPACLKINTQNNCYVMDPYCPSEEPNEEQSDDTVLPVSLFVSLTGTIVLLFILFLLYLMFRRNKCRRNPASDKDNELTILAFPEERLKIEEGPLSTTIFVVEDVLERKYSNGCVYGTSYVVSSVNQFSNIIPIIIHEKHMSVLQKEKTFILMKYMTLQDGTLKIGVQSVLMHTKKPESLKEEVIRGFQCPETITELGKINSLNIRERVSVKGEVTKVSNVMYCNGTKGRIITLSDGKIAIEVKLWGELVDCIVAVGSTVLVTCVHVDIYQEKRSFNSSVNTEVKIVDTEEDFSGTVNGVSFDESNLSILVGDDFMTCSSEQLRELFPESTFVENVKVKGKRRRFIVMFIEKESEDGVDSGSGC